MKTDLLRLAVLCLLLLSACSKKQPVGPSTDQVNPAYAEFVSGYTAGVIGSGASITISLAKDIVEFSEVGQAADAGLFSFAPSVKGTALWQDRRTIRFKPDNRLESGKSYEVSFKLGSVMTVPAELKTFSFNLQVYQQNFELTINNVTPYVKTELARQKIEATLATADYADGAAVEKVVTALQETKALKITWTHSADGKQHDLVVENVTRAEKAGTVTVTIAGAPIGVERTMEIPIEIPGLGDFKVLSARVEPGSTPYVVIQFSDPLNEKQSLQGLITLGNARSLEFEVVGNLVNVYPSNKQPGTQALIIEAGIQNVLKYKLKESLRYELLFEAIKPEVRFTGKGTVLPGTDGLVLPFEAVSLKAVDLSIVKIYETNVLQFLQVNDLAGNQEIYRVGKQILKKTIALDNSGATDLGKWNRFTLDLSTLIKTEPGAIYQVKLDMKRRYSVYPCTDTVTVEEEDAFIDANEWAGDDLQEGYYDDEEYEYYGEGYDWEQRDNPCHKTYYMQRRGKQRNVIASDLGLLSKRGSDGNTLVFVTDLKTSEPMSGIGVELFDYQQQSLGTGSTGSDGKVVFTTAQPPAFVVAKSGEQRGYLKVADGEALSLSNFNISGERIDGGVKGFLYGERGVWRPGDSLYMSFILESKSRKLPDNHPVVFELENPLGQVTMRSVRSSSMNGFYTFPCATATDAPTGNWIARAKVGPATFTRQIRIETVKPNRLKISLNFNRDRITAADESISGDLTVNWLQGNPGRNLKAEFDLLLSKGVTQFDKYPDYSFELPSTSFNSEDQRIFEGSTDNEGHAKLNFTIETEGQAPGVLNATIRGKVFEDGGNYSLDRFTIPYYPFETFVGIRVPPGDRRGMLVTDTTHKADIVTVDADGNPVSSKDIRMTLHKVEWRWWWDASDGEGQYMQGQTEQPVASGTISTVNGKGTWSFRINRPAWGRYLLRAYDSESGHSTGKFVYIDWPGWAGRQQEGRDGATMLSFSADKDLYQTGEKMTLTVPGSANGRALVTVENGSRVLESQWVNMQAGDNTVTLDAKPEMSPNCFVYITLLQPHAQTKNDLPIRMYGVIPVRVEDPQTHLAPTITMPDVLEPGQKVTLKVGEASNRKMTYTIAVVEDGLLDLTRFKTPDAWSTFYAREALGVRTWDLYNDVIGAFGGQVERLLAIGGDGEGDIEIAGKEGSKKNNRFKPVVRFMGPFTSDGGINEHTFVMPNYIGSVRTMVVAGYEGAYGKTEKTTPVRKPLMVLSTLPRVLGPEEQLKLPVTIFRMEPGIKNVKIDVSVEGPVTLTGAASQSVVMNEDDLTTEFDLSVKAATGWARIIVKASSGNATATDDISIEVRNPNQPITRVTDAVVEAGKSWSGNVAPSGLPGTNTAIVELSRIPPINLGQRLNYLITYPYGCVEQTTSSAFGQLNLDRLVPLTPSKKAEISAHITLGVQRLRSFQTNDGGFAYWPGGDDADSWSTSYAGHFLIEAEARGYFVPQELMRRWKGYQRSKSQAWRRSQQTPNADLIQAYRLYTLAHAGEPDMGAMNRMRELSNLPSTAAWMLAAAYSRSGQKEAAKQFIANLPLDVKPYREMAYTYGSDLRDKAIILETLVLLDERSKGAELVKDISANLSNSGYWYSTQTLSWCLKAIASFSGGTSQGSMTFSYSYKDKKEDVQTDLPMMQIELPVEAKGDAAIKIDNTTQGVVFVRTITRGTPSRSQDDAVENNIGLAVTYTNRDGTPLNPASVEQGTTFVVAVTVTNPGLRGAYKNVALHHVFASGWEVNNLKMADSESALKSDYSDYQDIRDDRVYTYFDLGPSQRKTFRYLITASFAGSYYLPGVRVEAMYDQSISSRTAGQSVTVAKKSGTP